MEVKLFLLSLIYFIKTCVKSESDLEKAVLVNTQDLPLLQLLDLVRKEEFSSSWGKEDSKGQKKWRIDFFYGGELNKLLINMVSVLKAILCCWSMFLGSQLTTAGVGDRCKGKSSYSVTVERYNCSWIYNKWVW